MYDFQIIVPCVKERLSFFQKFGLYNIKNTKILIYCLVNDKKDFLDGWPKEVDVEFIENDLKEKVELNRTAKYPHFAPEVFRIYNLLSTFTVEKAKRAKWTIKMDDDCYNDFFLMNYYFDKYFDYERDYYLVGEIRTETDKPEIECLKNLGLWKGLEKTGWQHEIEFCAFSQSSMLKIVENKNCQQLFALRADQKKGYTDQTLGLAANLCKIYPIVTTFIESSGTDNQFNLLSVPYEERFSKTNSNIAYKDRCFVHFHPMKEDRYNILEQNLQSELNTKEENKTKNKNIRRFF
jgi:hypothetical protein